MLLEAKHPRAARPWKAGWLLLIAAAAAGCADSADRSGAAAAPAAAAAEAAAAGGTADAVSPPQEGELLLASPPGGWIETGALATAALRMAEYGPAAEDEGTMERVTFEAQPGRPLPDPIDFVLGVSRDLAKRCKSFADTNIASGLENGYPTSVRLLICNEFDDGPQGQVVMAKAIQGKEQFYVITRRRLGPAATADVPPLSAQAMAEWSAYFKGIRVCDTRDPEHPCPTGGNGIDS